MRTNGQMPAVMALQKVGYATNADHCDGCNIHPPSKQFCAERLAVSALALQYGKQVRWRSPSFHSQVATARPPSMTVRLNDVSPKGLYIQYPYNYQGGSFDCSPGTVIANGTKGHLCGWASMLFRTNCTKPTPGKARTSLIHVHLHLDSTRAL